MDYEQYIETRNQLRGIVANLDFLSKRESLFLSEDALTINLMVMTLRIMLVAWEERYAPTPPPMTENEKREFRDLPF